MSSISLSPSSLSLSFPNSSFIFSRALLDPLLFSGFLSFVDSFRFTEGICKNFRSIPDSVKSAAFRDYFIPFEKWKNLKEEKKKFLQFEFDSKKNEFFHFEKLKNEEKLKFAKVEMNDSNGQCTNQLLDYFNSNNEILSSIRSLKISNYYNIERFEIFFPQLKNLKTLEIFNCTGGTLEFFNRINELSKLEILSISEWSNFPDGEEFQRILLKDSSLKEIHFKSIKLCERSFESIAESLLKGNNGIQKLYLDFSKNYETFYSSLFHSISLTNSLKVFSFVFQSAQMEKLPLLQSLINNKSIEYLLLENLLAGDEYLIQLKNHSQLHSLYLKSSEFTNFQLGNYLENHLYLNSLIFDSINFQSVQLNYFASGFPLNSSLKSLAFININFHYSEHFELLMKSIGQCKSLKSLKFDSIQSSYSNDILLYWKSIEMKKSSIEYFSFLHQECRDTPENYLKLLNWIEEHSKLKYLSLEFSMTPKLFMKKLIKLVKKKNKLIEKSGDNSPLFQLKFTPGLHFKRRNNNFISGRDCAYFCVMFSMVPFDWCCPSDSIMDDEQFTALGQRLFDVNFVLCSPIWCPLASLVEIYRQSRICCNNCECCD